MRDPEISGAGEGGNVDWQNTLRSPKGQELDALGSVLLSQPGSAGAREAMSSRIRTWPSHQGIKWTRGPQKAEKQQL